MFGLCFWGAKTKQGKLYGKNKMMIKFTALQVEKTRLESLRCIFDFLRHLSVVLSYRNEGWKINKDITEKENFCVEINREIDMNLICRR